MTTTFLNQLENLPAQQRQVLLDFAEYLVRKYAKPKPKKRRKAGTLKGFLVYMADDFDAPLEDFKEYME
ncbi:MAG: DUF2281 domain-containing protein [Saprospiraceae bacterium]